MSVDPRLQPLVDFARPQPMPALSEVARVRAEGNVMALQGLAELEEPGPDMAGVSEETVPVHDGDITVRIYRPSVERPLPVCVYVHGGAFWAGSLDLVDAECRRIAGGAECMVVSVDYRLAPEHPFPTPLEDCYAALLWTMEHAGRLGIDPQRVTIAGSSAGGNLAAAVALLARDRGGPRILAQVLIVPVMDLTLSHPSDREFREGYLFTEESLEFMTRGYLGPDGDPRNPLVSPLFADARGLPPALILTCEYDPLRDGGEAYGERLRASGVPASVHRYPGMLHGTFGAGKLVPEVTDAYYREITDFLSGAFRSRAAVPTSNRTP